MSERSVVITEENGEYKIHNSALSEFELLGLFEQIVFDLKYSKVGKTSASETQENNQESESSAKPSVETISTTVEAKEQPSQPSESEPETVQTSAPRIAGVTSSAASDLRTRIGNAVKAIRDLGGRVEAADLSKMTDEELQTELEELTAQYKRLKNSKVSNNKL